MLKRAKPVPGKYAPGSSVLKHCMLSLDRMVSCMDVSSPVSHFQSFIQPSRRGLTYVILKQLHIPTCTYIHTHNIFIISIKENKPVDRNKHLIDEAIRFERDSSHSEVEFMHALLKCEQVAIHCNLHDSLSVNLNHQAAPLLLNWDLR